MKKQAMLIVVICLMFSITAFATSFEDSEELQELMLKNDKVELMLKNEVEKNPNYVGEFQFLEKIPFEVSEETINSTKLGNIIAQGDIYEPNDSPEQATPGLKGQLIRATIHNEDDRDWYRFEVTQEEVNNREYFSIILTNIPRGCDYDMFVANSDFSGVIHNIKDGNEPEEIIGIFTEPGTYYVTIQSKAGYSSSPYKLYFGRSFYPKTTGLRNPGLTFNFGYVPRENDYDTWANWKNYDLSHDYTIPDNSIMTELYMDSNGNNGYWAGFYKVIREPSGYGMKLAGNFDKFNVPDMSYYVKQNWEINGYVRFCDYFIWEPRIKIDYKFVVTADTIPFL